MTKTRLALLGLLLLAATAPVPAGGWAVTTIENLPDHVVAGTSWRLRFAVRQHGVTLATGLTPSVTATKGRETVTAMATPAARAGRYESDLVLPSTGDWSVAITAWGTTSIMMPVIAPNQPAPAVSDAERGARQFVASGCVTCHRHEAITTPVASADIGPALTGRRYAPASLSVWLENAPCVSGKPCMPRLDLSAREIGALTAFLNREPARVALSHGK